MVAGPADATNETPSSVRTGAQAVDRAINVLYALSAAGYNPMTITELAAVVGFSIPTTYRLAQALLRGRLLEKVPGTDLYRIGPGVAELAASRTPPGPRVQHFAPHLHALSASIGITASLAVVAENRARTVYSAFPPVRYCSRQLPEPELSLTESAMGRALVVFGPRGPRQRHAAQIGDVDAIRRRGYAESVTGVAREVTAIAVPVFDSGGHVAAAIGVQAFNRRLTATMVDDIVPIMRHAAGPIGEVIGSSTAP